MNYFTPLPLLLFILFGCALQAQKYATAIQYRDTVWTETRDSLITKDILYDTDQYGLLAKEIKKLDDVVHKARAHDSYDIDLVGYADFRGTDEYNQALADRRVKTVKDYFLLRRLAESLIHTQVVGEVPPLEEVSDPEKDLQPYRHVTVRATVFYKEILKDSIREELLVMTCPESDTIIRFANGVVVLVEGCSFPGYRIKDLNFEFSMVASRADMLANRLPTITDRGECLLTAGMLFFSVTNDRDRNVYTQPDMPMTVRIPTGAFEEGMQLFDATTRGSRVVSWTPSDEELEQETDNQNNFYVLQTTGSLAKNLDVPTGVFTLDQTNPKPYFKIRVFKESQTAAFLSGKRSNLTADFFHKRKFYYSTASCIPENEQMVTLFVKRKKKSFVFHKPLSEIKRQGGWFIGRGDRYLVRKRDFQQVQGKSAVYDLLAGN